MPRTQPLYSPVWLKELAACLSEDNENLLGFCSQIEAVSRVSAIDGALLEMVDLLFGNLPNRVLHDLAQVARMRLAELEVEKQLTLNAGRVPEYSSIYKDKVAAQSLLQLAHFHCINRTTTNPDGSTHYEKK
jgi:hypothetical protein